MAEPRKPFLLRIGAELRRELEAWAENELRSVNGQIEYLLREAVSRRKREGLAPTPTPPEITSAPAAESTPGHPSTDNAQTDQHP